MDNKIIKLHPDDSYEQLEAAMVGAVPKVLYRIS